MSLSQSVLKALPVVAALFSIAADGDACQVIFNNGDEGGDAECTELDEVCPNLECDNGNVVDRDGCPICECADAPVCDVANLEFPECANPRFDDESCAWVCDGDPGCFSDGDCGPGFICQSTCGGRESGASEEDCASAGICVQVGGGCFSDFDCGRGFRCEQRDGGDQPGAPDSDPDSGDGGAPNDDGDDGAERPDDDQADPAPPPPPSGQCVRIEDGCFEDSDCGEGFFCDFLNNPGAVAVREGGVCRELETPCFVDEECREGQHCEFLTDASGLVARSGVCIDDGLIECNFDGDCRDGQVCAFVATDGDCSDGDGDGACDGLADVPGSGGVCVDVDESCSSDTDCGEGETCALLEDCVCTAECRDDGNGGCLPCECPIATSGVCVALTTECFEDIDCPDGGTCALEASGCDRPCEVNDDGSTTCFPCDPVLSGHCVAPSPSCFSDTDCHPEDQCVFDEGPTDCVNGADCRPAFAPQGTCQPRDADPCADCNGSCVVDADGRSDCIAP